MITARSQFSERIPTNHTVKPILAPPWHHAAYTLIPVPKLQGNVDWDLIGKGFVQRVLTFLDERGFIPDLRARLVYRNFVTPKQFEIGLGAFHRNGFGVEPRLTQTAFFRPYNRSEDVGNLYLVGQGTRPGGGTPSVIMSAKMTVREIARDFDIPAEIVSGVPEYC